ncbi:MAG: DUF2147 domain-containing protein, partial [Rhizobiaceae bacterium]|nr:DUF2147 domain-containing protein [Rhizobiaceae bacterium]
MRTVLLALVVLAASSAAGLADPIEGDWRTQAGPMANIAPCGGKFCIKLKTGRHAGKRIGVFSPTGDGEYSGTITDPSN